MRRPTGINLGYPCRPRHKFCSALGSQNDRATAELGTSGRFGISAAAGMEGPLRIAFPNPGPSQSSQGRPAAAVIEAKAHRARLRLSQL